MDLQSFNPWWKTGNVSTEFTGRKRKIFDEIVTYVDKRQHDPAFILITRT